MKRARDKARIRVQWAVCAIIAVLTAGCADDPPPRKVTDFLEDPIGLEATLARCNANRSTTRDDPECKNAREANNRLAAEEEKRRQAEFELESQRKRDAIRQRNEAAAAAARRAEEAARAREEALYEQQFDNVDPSTSPQTAPTNTPAAEPPAADNAAQMPAVEDSGSAPAADENIAPPASDLEQLRQELNRRNQEADSTTNSEDDPPAN